MTKVDGSDGALVQRERIAGNGSYYASPVTGDGKVYFADDRGVLSVVADTQEWKMLSSHKFGEKIQTTPVINGDRLYIRSEKALYAFQSPRERVNSKDRTLLSHAEHVAGARFILAIEDAERREHFRIVQYLHDFRDFFAGEVDEREIHKYWAAFDACIVKLLFEFFEGMVADRQRVVAARVHEDFKRDHLLIFRSERIQVFTIVTDGFLKRLDRVLAVVGSLRLCGHAEHG